MAYPVASEGGTSSNRQYVVTEVDLTQYYLMERELLQTEKMAGVGKMVAGVTHELKNPLAVIKGASYLLKQSEDPIVKDEALEEIDNNLLRAEKIVYSMLDFSKPDRSGKKLCNVKAVVQQILLLLRQDLLEGRIDTDILIDDQLAVYGNSDSMKHIFLNLFTNAMEATCDGGCIIMTGTSDAETATLKIENTGSQIQEENLQHIFDPFFTTKENGTGLGLWIVSNEVRKNNGSIELCNTGRGVVAILKLPSQEPQEPYKGENANGREA